MGGSKRKKVKPNSTGDSASDLQEEIVEQSDDTPTIQVESKTNLCSRCLHGFKYFILLILIPPILNYAALQQEQKYLLQESGSVYDIGGGQHLYLACVGTGKPTVLLDAPTGSSSDVWGLLVKLLANTTKVCYYDRAGLGHSERPYKTRVEEEKPLSETPPKDKWQHYTIESMLDDVHRLITYSSQQLDKPFVYVGSELGALVARFYTQIYETDVSDLVLVDPLVETLFLEDEGIWTEYWFNHLIPSYQTMQISAATGITRLALLLGAIEPPLHDIQGDNIMVQKQKHLLCHPKHLSSVVDEHHFINQSFSQMQTVFTMKQFPQNVPITVITGNYYDEQLPSALNKAWAKSQQHLMSVIHPNSNHIVVNGADRKMIYRNPEALAEPIKRLVKQRRQKLKTENS